MSFYRSSTPPMRRRRLRAWFTDFSLLTHYCEICNGPLIEDAFGERACLHCQWSEPSPKDDENV